VIWSEILRLVLLFSAETRPIRLQYQIHRVISSQKARQGIFQSRTISEAQPHSQRMRAAILQVMVLCGMELLVMELKESESIMKTECFISS
jgi:hypothetical protein